MFQEFRVMIKKKYRCWTEIPDGEALPNILNKLSGKRNESDLLLKHFQFFYRTKKRGQLTGFSLKI